MFFLQDLYRVLYTRRSGDRDSYDNVAVVFSDGRATELRSIWQEASIGRSQGIHYIVVLLGVADTNARSLGGVIANLPQASNLMYATTMGRLPRIQSSLIDLVCNSKCLFVSGVGLYEPLQLTYEQLQLNYEPLQLTYEPLQ